VLAVITGQGRALSRAKAFIRGIGGGFGQCGRGLACGLGYLARGSGTHESTGYAGRNSRRSSPALPDETTLRSALAGVPPNARVQRHGGSRATMRESAADVDLAQGRLASRRSRLRHADLDTCFDPILAAALFEELTTRIDTCPSTAAAMPPPIAASGASGPSRGCPYDRGRRRPASSCVD